MKKYLLSAAALMLFAGGAQAASVYSLTSVKYSNTFTPTPTNVASCTGCGIGTVVDDGFGNLTLAGIAWSFNAGGNSYTTSFGGTSTLAAGTSLIKAGGATCVNGVGTVCDAANVISGMALDFLTGIGSDGSTACANNRCRVDASLAGDVLTIAIKRALSESTTSTAFQTYTLAFTAIPVPGAVWLFGSALGLLGVARRRLAA